MSSVSTTPKVNASTKFRRAALAVQWSVKANNIMCRNNMHFQVETEPKEEKDVEMIKRDPIQPSTAAPALKTETGPLPSSRPCSAPHSSASVKFRRAAIVVQWSVMAKKVMPQPTIPEPRIVPEIKGPQSEEKKEILSPKPKASVKFRRAALAVQIAVQANRTIHQSHCAKIESTSQKEAQKTIDAAFNCINHASLEVTPIEFASMAVADLEIVNTQLTPPKVAEFILEEKEPPLPMRSCLRLPNSPSPEVKKSVTMKRQAPRRKTLPRSSCTEMVASIWYSRTDELQTMQDKLAKKMKHMAESTPGKEAQNIIDAAVYCIDDASMEVAPIEDSSMDVAAIVVEETQLAATAVTEFTLEEKEPPLPRRSCLKSSDSSSPTVKKSVTMKRRARVRKTLPRSSYTEELVSSLWYSHAELQKMRDKFARQMKRKVKSASQKEAQNIIDSSVNCIEDDSLEEDPIDDAPMDVGAIEVEKTKFTTPEVAECKLEGKEPPLPRRSSLKSSVSYSPKVKKSVTMANHARIKKTRSRSSYTEKMAASVWYSRADLQKMQDKVARKIERKGVSLKNFWSLDGVFVPSEAQVVEKTPGGEPSASTNFKKEKVTRAPCTKGSDKLTRRKLPDFGSDMFPMLNISQQVQVCNRAA